MRDVRVGGDIAIPAGSKAIGSVMSVERGGKVKERARLGIRFHTLVLADGTQVPITVGDDHRNGEAPGTQTPPKSGAVRWRARSWGRLSGAVRGRPWRLSRCGCRNRRRYGRRSPGGNLSGGLRSDRADRLARHGDRREVTAV